MARITEEQIIQINEVYAECGVKSRTAKIVGVSVASVSKYLIPNYKKKADRVEFKFDAVPPGINSLLAKVNESEDKLKTFWESCLLIEEEYKGMREIQNSGEVF